MADLPLDKIHIRDLLQRSIIGIYDEERREKQDIIINITLHADLRAAGRSDRIEDTVDYKGIKQSVLALTEESTFYLVERLAEAIAQRCLEESLVQRVDVVIDKPHALRFARSVAVAVTRDREGDD